MQRNFCQFDGFFCEIKLVSSLVNSIAILLRDRRLGGYVFAHPWESYFIPRGFAPWDEIRLPRVAKSIASRSAITQYYIFRDCLDLEPCKSWPFTEYIKRCPCFVPTSKWSPVVLIETMVSGSLISWLTL